MDNLKSEKARNTKRKIIKAAEILLMDKDIHKVSISEITKKAGVAKGTFYLYFECKEELAWSIISNNVLIISKDLEILNDAPATKETIDKLIHKSVKFSMKNKTVIKLVHHTQFLKFINYEDKNNVFEEQFISIIKNWLDKGVENEVLDIKDTRFYATFIFLSVHEILERIILGELDFELAKAEQQLKEIVHKIIGW
ncbi:TetR family transcriptional regulator [Natranaerovirga hydrolytica]|uniref:TetR family transcriptional regulator n=1 Tax=Natranaerovirga hydrolytica TaxID=680378 RepID=A0A4R1MLE0_9FIRM|nr:TetR/AcrR family transcriptional regulator [Natranaerovirga hydrolytica]TCK93335.1 TetR family transcriptional regulator [Natranaerovirga hydrolytica]